MDPTYAHRYRELYDHHWWWGSREAMILGLLESYQPSGGYGDILDVGCGEGLFFGQLRALGEPEGVEPDGDRVSGIGRDVGTIHVGPFDETFQPGKRYGLIVMLDVLEHIEQDQLALDHARDLLENEGLLVVTVPALESLWTAHDDHNHQYRRYRRTALRSSIRDAGLDVLEAHYCFGWTVPAKLLVRFKERALRGPSASETVPSRPVNRLLRSITEMELKITRRWAPPLGTSVVAVARRGCGCATDARERNT